MEENYQSEGEIGVLEIHIVVKWNSESDWEMGFWFGMDGEDVDVCWVKANKKTSNKYFVEAVQNAILSKIK